MGEQTLTIIGFPNRFQIFRANNPSDVFTQKCLCTTQEYFLPLDKKSSEIEELEIRRKNIMYNILFIVVLVHRVFIEYSYMYYE